MTSIPSSRGIPPFLPSSLPPSLQPANPGRANPHSLEEKFRIYNRDDLASALRARLSELPSLTSGFTPELLSLFLLISDRPLENSRVDDVDALVPAEEPKGLTWADIVAQDPLVGPEWQDVDFGAESSDEWSDDGVSAQQLRDEIIGERKLEEEGRKKKVWSTEEEGEEEERERERAARGVGGLVVGGDREGLEALKKGQYWNRLVAPVEAEVDVSLGFGGGISLFYYYFTRTVEMYGAHSCLQWRMSQLFPSSRLSVKSCSCFSATPASSSANPPPPRTTIS